MRAAPPEPFRAKERAAPPEAKAMNNMNAAKTYQGACSWVAPAHLVQNVKKSVKQYNALTTTM